MTKSTMKIALAMFATGLFASTAYAEPLSLTDVQMDSVAAGGESTPTGFICPVISTDAVLNSVNGIAINGAYSILGPEVAVPVNATNGDGTGSPGGTYSSPGDTDYTAIWYTAG